MNLRDKVLGYLEEHKDAYVSGEQLAELFGVSRAAVWKAIKRLQEEGHEITAVTGRGYRLSAGSDILSSAGIARYLRHGNADQIIVHSAVDSTNNVAKEMALKGAAHGTVIAAERQTSGRGRLGRSFESPEGTGIYLTIIMRPRADIAAHHYRGGGGRVSRHPGTHRAASGNQVGQRYLYRWEKSLRNTDGGYHRF